MSGEELSLIDPNREKLILEICDDGSVRKITGRQYQRKLRKAHLTNLVLLGIIIILSVALYIAQAGPM